MREALRAALGESVEASLRKSPILQGVEENSLAVVASLLHHRSLNADEGARLASRL